MPSQYVPSHWAGVRRGTVSLEAGGAGEPVSGAGHYYNLGIRVGTDGVEDLDKFRMGTGAPLQSVAVAVQGHLQDAVFPFQPGKLETILVFL